MSALVTSPVGAPAAPVDGDTEDYGARRQTAGQLWSRLSGMVPPPPAGTVIVPSLVYRDITPNLCVFGRR